MIGAIKRIKHFAQRNNTFDLNSELFNFLDANTIVFNYSDSDDSDDSDDDDNNAVNSNVAFPIFCKNDNGK